MKALKLTAILIGLTTPVCAQTYSTNHRQVHQNWSGYGYQPWANTGFNHNPYAWDYGRHAYGGVQINVSPYGHSTGYYFSSGMSPYGGTRFNYYRPFGR